MRKFKPVRVQASAIEAADFPNYWIPVIIAISPDIAPGPSGRGVIPKLCGRREWALSRAEEFISTRCATWRRRRDGWRVAPDGDTSLPEGASWYLHFPDSHAAA